MKRLFFATALIAGFVLVYAACERSSPQGGRDVSCDDGTDPSCRMVPPTCESYEILAYQNSCYVCVNADTCAPWGEAGCGEDADCDETQYCDMCASSSCPGCDDCVPGCVDHGCPTENELTCYGVREDCGQGRVAIIQDGCWVCVDMQTCDPGRNTSCDDGTEPICLMPVPVCEDHEILAHQDQCYACVNPATCKPWGEAGCHTDLQCPVEDYCDPCATSSCPTCEDCVPGCLPHRCPTQAEPLCNMLRPDCGDGKVSVVKDGCWVCVDASTCEAARNESCDDGTEPTCEMPVPTCEDHEVLAYQNYCYVCVNAATCLPWGEAQCEHDWECVAQEYCDPCGTSSCPMCADCVAACVPHGCPTENEALCNEIRPDCNENEVAVVQEGCWVCVSLNTCQ